MTETAVTEVLGELLSPSQANTYLTCPAKRYFRYLVGLSEPTTGALALGKAFHGTLARHFRQKMTTGRDMENGELSEALADGIYPPHRSTPLCSRGYCTYWRGM